jgi:hypothetical protein
MRQVTKGYLNRHGYSNREVTKGYLNRHGYSNRQVTKGYLNITKNRQVTKLRIGRSQSGRPVIHTFVWLSMYSFLAVLRASASLLLKLATLRIASLIT